MRPARVLLLTTLAMLAFAGNSVLCRLALKHTGIDPATFTSVRLASGALVLWLLVRVRDGRTARAGNWPSALALFAYAAAFSWAYVSLPTAAGALLLFGAVQATMIGYGLWQGERLAPRQTLGLLAACAGLIALMLPGLSAPPLGGAVLMMAAGVAWGVYSLRGKGGGDATQTTSGNFQRAALLTLILSALTLPQARLDGAGLVYAVVSGVRPGLRRVVHRRARPARHQCGHGATQRARDCRFGRCPLSARTAHLALDRHLAGHFGRRGPGDLGPPVYLTSG